MKAKIVSADNVPQLSALLMSGLFLLSEVMTKSETRALQSVMSSPHRVTASLFALPVPAVLAGIIIGLLYFSMSRNVEIPSHSSTMSNHELIADLFIKGLTVTGVLIEGSPSLIISLLFLFTADLIVKGRFFLLSKMVTVASGALMIGLAFLTFVSPSPTMLLPLAAFFLVSLTSVGNMIRA